MNAVYKQSARTLNNTPVSRPIPTREADMTVNNTGGYVFSVTPMEAVKRFLIIGSDKPTYYTSAQTLTAGCADNLRKVLNSDDGIAAVNMIAHVSTHGSAPKVSPALYALAEAFASNRTAVRSAASRVLPDVVRTNSHMLEFISYANELRGWGRLLRESVGNWYNRMPIEKLEYQVAKYRNRFDWTTRDALRMSKPKPTSKRRSDIYGWVVGKDPFFSSGTLWAVDEAARYPQLGKAYGCTENQAAQFIVENKLTREMVPTTWLNSANVWGALLCNMPMTAMIRSLGKMAAVGLLVRQSEAVKLVRDRLLDADYLRKSRIHPINVLNAMAVYSSGKGVKGNLTWSPIHEIVDVLDSAFYASFGNVTPSNKRTLIALDVSASMAWSEDVLSPREVSAAMAMVVMHTEPEYRVVGFSRKLIDLPLSTRMRLDGVIKRISGLPFSYTDASLPLKEGLKWTDVYDTFVTYTDNEVNTGGHPAECLTNYAVKKGVDARMAVCAVTATNCTIADPANRNMLDLVGFDSSSAQVLSDFSAGKL